MDDPASVGARWLDECLRYAGRCPMGNVFRTEAMDALEDFARVGQTSAAPPSRPSDRGPRRAARRGGPDCVRARTRADRAAAPRATDREVLVLGAVLATGSEKAAAHRLGVSHSTVKHHLANARSKVGAETTAQLVWILSPRLPQPEGVGETVE